MAKNYTAAAAATAPLSRFGVLVAQLESIVASAAHKSPEPLLCFDLLSDLISAIDEDTKENILLWQRRCEDALYSLLVIGARRPVRHLASVAMAKIISKGDAISIYSRASSLQGFLSDGKRSEPHKIAGAAQCLGELYKHFGRRITSGLLETTIIATLATKLMKFHEEFVRQEALYMLRNALEGSGGSAASTAYSEAFRLIMRSATGDKSFAVWQNLTIQHLIVSRQALEDQVSSVRDAFAETLGSLLALGMNPEAQVQPRGKGPLPQAKVLEGGLQKHLILAFTKASGVRSRVVRVGLTLSWVFFLQAIRIKYLHSDSELQNFALQVMEMLRAETSVDAHSLACVLYVLRVGVTDQMTEPTQRNFLVFLGQQLQSPEAGPYMKVAALRTLSYTLKTLGEVPIEFKDVLDNTIVAAVSHSSKLVRIEAALALRALAEVDPTCVGGLTSYGVTNLTALRESVSFEKGSNLQLELDSLHGQATVLAALVSVSPKLPLGYPARLPRLVFGVSKKLLTEHSRNPGAAAVEKEAGWLLLSSLLASLPKEELEDDVFDILALWATLFTGNPENEITKTEDLMSRIYVWSAAVHALTAFIECFISPNVVNDGVLLQPVLLYLNSALSYISALRAKELPHVKPAVDIFIIKTLIAYQSLPDPASFKNDHPQIIQLCTFPFRRASECKESSCLRSLLDKRDAWLGPWIPGRFELRLLWALRALAEVDPTCVGGLTSYGVTNLTALRESVSFEKGSNLQLELDSLHGQATVLAALVSVSPKLPLGYPARLPRLVFGVSKKLLTEHSRNPGAAAVEKEAGWLLLSSLLASLPKEELEDDVFDILALWATLFTGNPENEITKTEDLMSRIYVWSAAVHALTAFIECFISPNVVNDGVLLQPVLLYLNSALSYISALRAKELPHVKPAVDIFIIKTLIAYQSLPDPASFKNDHPQIIQLCTFPFRRASECKESSCLRSLLDKRDAWLGPWIPGRDWFEDELRAFQGGKDGIMPCVWENEISSFPQPETISKTLVNQMLLLFGIIFASQDSGGMLSLVGIIEQCLKAGKKQHWRSASITNICVGLLAGFKALLSFRAQTLGQEILGLIQSIFQSILAEGDICASQRRASSEGLGYLARFGNDIFTARMTRSLLGDLNGATDSYFAGSIALALGCIHRSAGGIALSTLVPATVSSISSLAKSSVVNLQSWSMHGLLLTIEAAGLSFVSHVQATLSLAMDILLSDENGLVDVQQGVGRLINAIVTVLGPELVPGSIFFSRSKSAIAEISCWQETSTLLESARFTQQLVLFAPLAVSVHSHVQTLLSTLSSRQPNLRHLAVSTLRHLIEKDPASVIVEQIEDNLFFMLDEETDSEIGNLVQSTIMRLLYASCPSCPSHWISVCRKVVLATSMRNIENNIAANDDNDSRLNLGDEDNMVSGSNSSQIYQFQASIAAANREKFLRYRTRLFAAECLSHLPDAVGRNPAHFDLLMARKENASGRASSDWLVLHLQELISLAYQISTIQFESMQPVGVSLLGTIVDKFEKVADPELPGHLLLEQYQAQVVSAVRTTLDTSSSPSLLEAGLHLATKVVGLIFLFISFFIFEI
ncbi:protein SWEETIE-like [Lotus japonicus]|uniref:protein SWEETIE-like n=1 Tax=Lotus japonicus TaxID=34305 RepID=UPI0025895B91|nr:protein SWEETIE-like [Lotus japonicus]